MCPLGAPYSLSESTTSKNTQWILSWLKKPPSGTTQLIRVDDSQSEVENGCPNGCMIKQDIGLSPTSYTANGTFVDGTTYYWRIVNYQDIN
jgi:hypothetical protein